jgi:hypothetical protein
VHSRFACEKIREHADTFLHSDDEILLYVQDRLRRNEKKAAERYSASYRQSCRSIWVEPAPLRARSR